MTDERSGRNSGGCVIVALVVLLVAIPPLYLLSCGPIHWLEVNTPLLENDVMQRVLIIYATPARLLLNSGYGDWLMNYIDLWGN